MIIVNEEGWGRTKVLVAGSVTALVEEEDSGRSPRASS